MKKILIVSNFFYPEITPRAMRTTELAKEFARRGYSVTLVIPNKKIYHDNPPGIKGVKTIFADTPVSAADKAPARRKFRKFIPEWGMRFLLYFYNHEYFAKYDKGIEKRLMELDDDFDMLLSISYPAAIHRAVMKAFKRNGKLTAKFKAAEFSDPPLRGEYNKSFFPAYSLFLKKAGRFFDRFVIPVENAKTCYLAYKPADEISVIPQGFDNSGIKTKEYTPNTPVTFGYAGRFYRNTRDPEPLFKYLAQSGRDFRFHIYLIDCEPYFEEMLSRYQEKCKGEIIIHGALPRNELIYELSGMDFLVNHNFNYRTATPSKLIDYVLTGRPVFSFSSDNFEPSSFGRFLDRDYKEAIELPSASDYDIGTIVNKFEALL